MKDECNRDIEYLKRSLKKTGNVRGAYCMRERREDDIEKK